MQTATSVAQPGTSLDAGVATTTRARLYAANAKIGRFGARSAICTYSSTYALLQVQYVDYYYCAMYYYVTWIVHAQIMYCRYYSTTVQIRTTNEAMPLG